MKCIRCGNDSRYKDRGRGICPGCHKPFAFEPRTGSPLSDAAFKSALDAVSANERLRWGVEHLYYEVCRRKRAKFRTGLGCLLLLLVPSVGLTSLALQRFRVVPSLLAALGAVSLWLLIRAKVGAPYVKLTLEQFNVLWERWKRVHGAPPGVIVRKESVRRTRSPEPDLADYSFDRAVVCDRARTVDLLLANNFHFENNCAVLSVSGYPAGPFETVRAMLKRNPRLHVFALHDATPEGCRLAHLLATSPLWFKGHAIVTDVGLRPDQAGPFRGLYLPGSPGDSVQPGSGIRTEEARWLTRQRVELAAIRPEQVLKRLYRALNRRLERPSERTESDTSNAIFIDEDRESFSAQATDSEGGADGFG